MLPISAEFPSERTNQTYWLSSELDILQVTIEAIVLEETMVDLFIAKLEMGFPEAEQGSLSLASVGQQIAMRLFPCPLSTNMANKCRASTTPVAPQEMDGTLS